MCNFLSTEICAISKISKKEIGRCFKLILKALETSVHLITTTDFMVSEISFTFYLVTLNKTKRQEGLKFKGILPVLFLEFSLEFLLLSLLVIKECKKPWSWLSKKEILKWENVWERPVFSVSMVWVIKHRADSINATFLLSRIYKKMQQNYAFYIIMMSEKEVDAWRGLLIVLLTPVFVPSSVFLLLSYLCSRVREIVT